MKKLFREMSTHEKLNLANFHLSPKFKVLEDNGGGLYLFVFDRGVCIYAHCGYEYVKNQLRNDIIELERFPFGEKKLAIKEVKTWGGNENNPHKYYEELMKFEDNNGVKLVMDENHTYFESMGIAASVEFNNNV